tara:strand:+ start:452 stop:1837 length:1386 start_codon:yes stop_codon:yes gene_type:complete
MVLFGFFMTFRIIALFIGLIGVAAVCSTYILSAKTAPISLKKIGKDSLALAPITLGNPSTIPGITTNSPKIVLASNFPKSSQWIEHTVHFAQGDTLAKLLARIGVSKQETHKAILAFSKIHNPRHIRQGDEFRIAYLPHAIADTEKWATPGTFMGLFYNISYDHEIRLFRHSSGEFVAVSRSRNLSRRLVRAEGIITSSLYLAGKKQNLPDSTLAELIRLFSWDVDFQRDIRKNDSFKILYNRILDKNGKIIKGGKIFFAALSLGGKTKPIYRFKGNNNHVEYFDKNGHSAQKALMRTPIDGARLSSRFGRRRHPILGFTKMHRGLDFAAPLGTPIYAAGNGTINFIGSNGAYGRYIRIRHNKTYQTAYAHMSRFARSVRKNRRVRQGQVIGYVGSTGRSTGPHLHYEILRNGRQVNPLRIRMPSGRKLHSDELARFHIVRESLDQRYERLTLTPTNSIQR